MAALNAGSVYYTVEAETDQLLSSNKTIDASIDKTANSFKKLDTQVTKTASAVNGAISGMGRNAGMAGIQIQQFVGQIQGGQNAMVALSQQSADLGFVLGVPLLGAIAGISASIAGMLLPNLFDSTDAAKTLETVMKDLDKVITESQSGVNVLSNEYAKLAKQNKVLAEATAISQLKSIQNGFDAITTSINESIDEFDGWLGSMNGANFQELSDYVNKAGNSIANLNDDFYAQDGLIFAQKATKELQSSLKVSAEEAINLGISMSRISQGGGVDSIQELGEKLTSLAKEKGPEASQALVDLQLKVQQLADKSVTLAEKQKILSDIMNGVKVQSEDQIDTFDQLNSRYETIAKSLKSQADMLGMTRSQSLAYSKAVALQEAAESGVSQATQDSIATSYDRQIAYAKETEATKAQEEADKRAAIAKKKSSEATKDALKADQDAFNLMKALKDHDDKDKEQKRDTVGRVGQSSDAMGLGIDTESRLDELQKLHDAELISDAEFNAQKLTIAQNYNDQVMALSEERFRQESEGNAFVMDSLDALSSAATNVFSGMLSGTMTAKQALVAFSNAIMNEAIGSLVQMGLQQIKNQIIGQSAAAANVATAAASGAAIAAAYAPAATAASIATSGGAATAGMGAVATVTPIMNGMLSGMAHDGISEVPTEGTWLLNKGERVYTNDSAKKIDQMFNRVMMPNPISSLAPKSRSGGGDNNQTVNNTNININVASDGSTTSDAEGQWGMIASKVVDLVRVEVRQNEANSMRPGGALWNARQRGR